MTPITESASADGQAVAEQAQEKLKDGAGAAKEQAANMGQQAQARAREQVDTRTTEAGERLKSTAEDARSMADQLRQQGNDGPAKLVEQAAGHADRVSSYLTEADADRMIRDVEDFGRKNPWAVMAGGLAVGFFAARAVSAASANRSQVGSGSTGTGTRGQLPAPQTAATGGTGATGTTPPPAPVTGTPTTGAYAGTDSVPANADLPAYGGGG